jgi:hypothetical protein
MKVLHSLLKRAFIGTPQSGFCPRSLGHVASARRTWAMASGGELRLIKRSDPNFLLNTVGLIASSASPHLFGFLSGACRCARPVHGSPRSQGIGVQIDGLANECPQPQ